MKQIITFLLLLASVVARSQEQVPGSLLLTLNNNTAHQEPTPEDRRMSIRAIDSLNDAYGCKSIRIVKKSAKDFGGIYLLQLANNNTNMAVAAEAYLKTGFVKRATPDATGRVLGTPNDTLFGRQWGLHNTGNNDTAIKASKAGADIDMLRAWDIETGDSSIVVAVVDAGIKADHPDFAGRLWQNNAEIPGNDIDDDNNGYVDDTLGWDFYVGQPGIADSNGHGTHVAGIIGANAHNTTGYAGVDHHCKLMVCKVTNSQGFYNYAWLIEAIYYAADMGADIINLSLGGSVRMQELQDAVDYAYAKGATLIAGSGNYGGKGKFYPAVCNNVIAVGATNALDTVAYFSNYGPHISVVAPGEGIYGLSHLSDTGSAFYFGTSQATPHVSGVAALLLAQDKTRTPDQIRQLLQQNAEDQVGSARDLPGFDERYGYGRLNAYRALTNAAVHIQDVPSQQVSFSLWPNPAQSFVNISLKEPAALTVSDISGRVYLTTPVAERHNINTSTLPRGTYLVTTGGETVKLILQ